MLYACMTNISTLTDLEFRKWLGNRLVVDQPLEPDDPLYEPLYRDDPGDPIQLILNDIELSEVRSLNFISGFRGCGKTTELFRLRSQLRQNGFFVAYANAIDYLLPSEPIDISDFFIVLAGSFSEAIERELQLDPAKEGFWTRFVHWLQTTNVQLNGIEAKAAVPGTDIGLNFKTSLREVASFRQRLRESMAARLGDLRRQVHEFFEFGRKKILEQGPASKGVVFIFDQLEQLRDTLSTEGLVAESVATLIANHRADLQIPLFHMVFTVPPWLKFKLAEMAKIRLLYNVKLWNNDDKRSPHNPGLKTMRRLVERRFTPDGMKRFFGKLRKDGSSPLADRLIEAAGGHFRDLLVLLRETLLRVRSLPISGKVLDAAIANLRSSFLPMPAADAEWLHEIAHKRDSLLKDRSPESVRRMTFFLDTHCALVLHNGAEWYDIHPIIRDEVEEIVQRETKPTSG